MDFTLTSKVLIGYSENIFFSNSGESHLFFNYHDARKQKKMPCQNECITENTKSLLKFC